MDEPDTQGSTPQFRTYASDVAKLTGSNTPLPKRTPSAPAPQTVGPITLPTKAAPVPPPPPVQPHEPPPAEIIPKAPSTDESREAVLARLRAKVAAATPPVEPARIIPKAPSTNEAREQVLARLKANTPAPSAAARPAPPPGLPPINRLEPTAPAPIHTYKSDFSDQAKDTGASRISILAAEQNALDKATPVPQLKEKKKSRLPLIAGAILLILAGGASIYGAIFFVTGHPPVVVGPSVPSLIFADNRVELKGERGELRAGLAGLSTDSLPQGGVTVAYVTYASTTAKGKTVMLPAAGGALISAMGLRAPDILLRNVSPESTVGVVHAGEETRPFFIFRVTSYERTFAGMLEWEGSMRYDLDAFYPPYPTIIPEPMGTSSPTTTEPVIEIATTFTDDVVSNYDVRVLRDSTGRAILLYGYRDKETLIVARDEAAFSELLARLASTRAQ